MEALQVPDDPQKASAEEAGGRAWPGSSAPHGEAQRKQVPHSEPHPLTVTRYDHELHAMHRVTYGYSWRCTCGARGERFETMREARQGKREHEQSHRQ